MNLRDILVSKGSKVWSISSGQTVHEALHILVNQKIGALLVKDQQGKIVGIISERDIMRGCYYDSKNLDQTSVSSLMTPRVIIGSPDDDIHRVMAVMTENRVRHIPVMDGEELLGIVSIGDVVRILLEDSQHQIKYLKEFITGPGQ